MGLYQTEKLCTAKETIIKMKRQPTKREKVFANHISNKGLICKLYRAHTTQQQRNKQPKLKVGRGAE